MIFVVDDDARIRQMCAGALRDAGYDVREFADGPAALAALDGNVALLLTDVLMPAMKGTELGRRAAAIRPDLPILFMSGDVGNTAPEEFGGRPLLAKPFTAATLSAAIAQLI